jgi:signal transduction histidine kinase
LDLTQFETGRLTIQPQELNLKEFIGQLIEKIEPNIKKNENTFQLVDELSLEILYADPVRLQQILYNVLENACKFTKNGTISLCVKENSTQNPPELHFEIKDNGEGIPMELQEHIFDLFTQADTSKSRKHEGLGLGLPLSRHLCQLMGGDITVQSSPKDGTTFRIHIPIMNDSI